MPSFPSFSERSGDFFWLPESELPLLLEPEFEVLPLFPLFELLPLPLDFLTNLLSEFLLPLLSDLSDLSDLSGLGGAGVSRNFSLRHSQYRMSIC